MRVHLRGLFTVVVAALVLAACGNNEPTTPGANPTTAGAPTSAGPSRVEVTLQEFAVGTVPATAAAGSVTFDIMNKGPDDAHEFVIFRTDLDPTALPTKANGSVDEEGEGIELVDEQEEIQVAEEADLTVDLTAGSYVLICNIYDAAEKEAHYQKGMRTAFTVT